MVRSRFWWMKFNEKLTVQRNKYSILCDANPLILNDQILMNSIIEFGFRIVRRIIKASSLYCRLKLIATEAFNIFLQSTSIMHEMPPQRLQIHYFLRLQTPGAPSKIVTSQIIKSPPPSKKKSIMRRHYQQYVMAR